MKKTVRIRASLLVLLVLCSIFLIQCAPQSGDPIVPSAPATDPAPTGTQPQATDPAPTETDPAPTETDPAPTEPPMLYANPLTGEPMAAQSESRPFAVSLNNVKAAQPQLGVSFADVLCEVMTEGGTTRCVGIYHDLEGIETLGSIRSARPYMLSLAQSFDAIFVHAGCSVEAKELFETTGWDHLDGVYGKGSSKYFYRDQDRLNAGYSKEHTMCITPESILSYSEKLKLTMSRPGGVDYGWQFREDVTLTGTAANHIRVRFSLSASTSDRIKAAILDYNAETGLYEATQYNKDYIDGQTGARLTFKNVLVLRCNSFNQGDSAGHLTIDMVGSGTGYYACSGQMVPIRWSRATTANPFTFTTEDGTPLVLAIGKSYIAFVSNKSVIDFS